MKTFRLWLRITAITAFLSFGAFADHGDEEDSIPDGAVSESSVRQEERLLLEEVNELLENEARLKSLKPGQRIVVETVTTTTSKTTKPAAVAPMSLQSDSPAVTSLQPPKPENMAGSNPNPTDPNLAANRVWDQRAPVSYGFTIFAEQPTSLKKDEEANAKEIKKAEPKLVEVKSTKASALAKAPPEVDTSFRDKLRALVSMLKARIGLGSNDGSAPSPAAIHAVMSVGNGRLGKTPTRYESALGAPRVTASAGAADEDPTSARSLFGWIGWAFAFLLLAMLVRTYRRTI